jgi:AcrR family transcriptional regulator
MSENTSLPARKASRRVARTRDRLGDALIALLLAKPFADITVQAVLNRAKVSRSTFYEHYRDKNDLFLSDVDEFFEALSTLLERTDDRSARVAPVTELFAHVAGNRALHASLTESGRMDDVRELGEAHFARSIALRLARQPRTAVLTSTERNALAHGLAGSLFSMLSWWMRQENAATPLDMDQLFHRTVPDFGKH